MYVDLGDMFKMFIVMCVLARGYAMTPIDSSSSSICLYVRQYLDRIL